MEERERCPTHAKNEPLYDGNHIIQTHETTKSANSHAKQDPSPESTVTGPPTQDHDDDPLPISSQPGSQHATYVVQVPKDLIYRVPPPEHALMLAERHAHQKKHKGSHCFSCQPCCSFFPFGPSRRKQSSPET